MGLYKPREKSQPGLTSLMVIAVILLFFTLSVISFSTTAEDAYISFRYAENIAAGHGLVFNEGGEPVEGFSNPTWVLLLVIANFTGIDTEIAGRCLGLLFGTLLLIEIILLFNILNRRTNTIGLLAALCIVTAPAFLFWMQAGLENALFIYLVVLSLRLVLIEDKFDEGFLHSWLPLLLIALTRPEGIIFPVIVAIWKFDRSAKEGSSQAKSYFYTWVILIAACLLVFITMRLIVFGEWLPNTFYAKVNNGVRFNFTAGFNYLVNSLKNTLWLPLMLPLLMVLETLRKDEPDRKAFVILIGSLALVYAIFILYAGGDIHPYDRFFVPFLVLGPIASFALVANGGSKGRVSNILTVLFVLYIAGNLLYSSRPKWRIEPEISRPPNPVVVEIAGLCTGIETPSDVLNGFLYPVEDILEYVGRDLYADPAVDGLLAVDQCGKIPYYYCGPVLDLLGLNDSEIADIVHAVKTWDVYAESVLNKIPEAFVFVYTDNHLVSRYYLENTVLSEPFQSRYALRRIYHADNVFRLIDGSGYSFPLELLLYIKVGGEDPSPVSDLELLWLRENEPIVDNPDGLAVEVEEFRDYYAGNPDRVVEIRVEYN